MCTSVTVFAPVLHLNCTALNQSESSNFVMYIITIVTITIMGMIMQNSSRRGFGIGIIPQVPNYRIIDL